MTELSPRLFERYQQEMRLRHYAPNTVRVYVGVLRAFVVWIHPVHPREATAAHVRAFQLHCLEMGLSPAYLSQVVSALKLLYIGLYGWADLAFDVPRPKRPRRLPYVPTRDEILQMADQTANRKHRLAILLLYAAGLRVSELVHLQNGDVDLGRLSIFVRQSKGKRDRMTLLSASLVGDVAWLRQGRPSRDWLFLSSRGGPWAIRSVQHVVRRCGVRAGLAARVSPHSLRHAFATHLLENGVDLLIIQSLLGHAKLSTTTRYVHMRDPSRLAVCSPL